MNYEESLSRLKKIVIDLEKEEVEVENENKKCDAEIDEIRKTTQEKISKLMQAKKKKLKTKETKINELQNEKMKIIGGIFMLFSKGKITQEELDTVSNIEKEIQKNKVTKIDSNNTEDNSEKELPDNSKESSKDSNN